MNANWKGKKLKNQENSDTPENNYFFVVSKEDGFIDNLNKLISDAFKPDDMMLTTAPIQI